MHVAWAAQLAAVRFAPVCVAPVHHSRHIGAPPAQHACASGGSKRLLRPHTYPTPHSSTHPSTPLSLLRDAIAEISQRSDPWATYLRGRLVDRVAADGSLAPVAQPMGDSQAGVPPIFQQFPLQCSVAAKLYKGWDTKIVAYRVRRASCSVR